MNRTRLLMIGVLALAIALLVSVYAYKNLQKTGGNTEPGVEVIVAADDLQVGTKVGERDIKVIRVNQSDLPAGAPRKKADVLGHGVILPITKGDFILQTKLGGENQSGLPALIPPGMRAISVRVNEVVSVAGFVTPGTRVDVLLTGTPGTGSDQQTTTVLQNVQVLASGHTLERTSTGEAQNTAVITLLVSPDDAQRLTLASTEGHIQLALRNPLDTKQEEVPASNSRGLFRGVAMPAPPPSEPKVHRPAPVKPAVQVVQPPPGVKVEVYAGDKRSDINCTEDKCEGK